MEFVNVSEVDFIVLLRKNRNYLLLGEGGVG